MVIIDIVINNLLGRPIQDPAGMHLPAWDNANDIHFSFIHSNAFLVTGKMPQSGKQPVLNLLRGENSRFSPRRGDSLHRFAIHFTSIATKESEFPLFGKESSRRGDSLV